MPDSDGRIRGISIPSVPWHEDHWPESQMAREIPARRAQNKLTQALIEARDAVRDADQLLWDKQTQNGSH